MHGPGLLELLEVAAQFQRSKEKEVGICESACELLPANGAIFNAE